MKNKKVIGFSILCLGLILFWRFNTNQVVSFKSPQKIDIHQHNKEIKKLHEENVNKRSPANAEVKQDSEWANMVTSNLKQSIDDGDEISVTPIKKTTYNRGKRSTPARKVLVVIKSKNGMEYSYNALVNEQNGKVIRSWNRTHHEIRRHVPSFTIPAERI
jgi:hypothetical protein